MTTHKHDLEILRPLAQQYAEIAALDIQRERVERYFKTVKLEEPRPIVLIYEIPWGEIEDDGLVERCEDEEYRSLEQTVRRTLYQWEHFQVDMVVPAEFAVEKRFSSSGIGMEVNELVIESDTGSYAAAHEYQDQLRNEGDLEKLELPVISYDSAATDRAVEVAESAFSGLLPVAAKGRTFNYNIWDRIAEYRGVDNLLMDLAMRPDFMHAIAKKFMEIGAETAKQMLELELLDTHPMILHCTAACAEELPAEDFDGEVRLKDVWGRCAAQIFSAVSPEMHDEFDLTYNQQLFCECGLLYYGCCEPLDTKVDILRKRFDNLRKVSITPWADPDVAADSIGGDYVMAAKPNPAFVGSSEFDPEQVRLEMERYLEAARRNGTTCEFVLKDISTITKRPENLTEWAETAMGVVDRYY